LASLKIGSTQTFRKKACEMGRGRKPWRQRIDRRIRLNAGRIDDAFLAPDQSCGEALLDDDLEKATEDRQPGPFADAGQAGVVRERLRQVITHLPTQAEPVGHHLHQLAPRAQPFEEQDELELEDDRVVEAAGFRRSEHDWLRVLNAQLHIGSLSVAPRHARLFQQAGRST